MLTYCKVQYIYINAKLVIVKTYFKYFLWLSYIWMPQWQCITCFFFFFIFCVLFYTCSLCRRELKTTSLARKHFQEWLCSRIWPYRYNVCSFKFTKSFFFAKQRSDTEFAHFPVLLHYSLYIIQSAQFWIHPQTRVRKGRK